MKGLPINKTTVISSVAIIGGLFIYKQFMEARVNKLVAGGAQ